MPAWQSWPIASYQAATMHYQPEPKRKIIAEGKVTVKIKNATREKVATS